MGYNLGQVAQGQVVPGPEAGTIFIPGLGVQKITDWREDIIYDAELLPVAIANGQMFTFFRNLAIAGVPKSRLFTNMVTPSQLPAGHRAIIYGIHFMPMFDANVQDAQAILTGGYVEFVTGDTKREKSGPIWSFQSPFGMTGCVELDGNALPVVSGQLNNGVPSPASLGKMQIPIDITNELTFQCTLTFFNAVTLFMPTMVYCILRAFINTPVR